MNNLTGEATTCERAEMRLPDHAANLARLEAVMERIGAKLDPFEFLRVVQRTYQELQPAGTTEEMKAKLRVCPSYEIFCAALASTRKHCLPSVNALAIGCGAGYAGMPASYAAGVVKEVFRPAQHTVVEECDMTPEMAHSRTRPVRRFNLIVTHSMMHRIASLQPFFTFIDDHLAEDGVLVMGHEPNARFFRNAECRATLEELRAANRRRRRLRSLADPSRWFGRAARLLGKRPERSLFEQVNVALRLRYGFSGDLTSNEIIRLIDIHRPIEHGTGFSIGLNGFDCQDLEREFLPGFRRLWLGTSGHLGYAHSDHLSKAWRERQSQLSTQYPDDGAVFSASWRKQPR
jgi:hypothetical protein